MENRTIELLAPAGSRDSFVAAMAAGADAIYVGGSQYGARAYAKNFTEEELLWAIDYAHLFGKRVYMTVNTLMKDQELQELPEYLAPYYAAGLDAVIVQDLGAVAVIRNCFPKLDIHASTQMTITSAEGVLLMEELGIRQVVPARELSLTEIKDIAERTHASIECFIHGAMCYSYSGKCLFSSLIGGRSGNRGRCAQPCRLPYEVLKQQQKISGSNEQYVLSLKDMCTIELIPELIQAGITSFKIEGRMKRPEYVAGVTRMYRKYIDLYLSLSEHASQSEKLSLPEKRDYQVARKDYEELIRLYTRSGSSKGYYLQKNGRDMLTLQKPNYETDEEDKFQELYEVYVNQMKKISAQAEVILKKHQPAYMRLMSGKTAVEVLGETVQEALNHPLEQENVLKQMHKTGNTDIELTHVSLAMDMDVFMPVKQLNELRRNGIEKLMAEMLAGCKRHDSKPQTAPVGEEGYAQEEQKHAASPCLSAYVETKSVLQSLCRIDGIQRFYISYADMEQPEEAVRLAKQAGKEVYLALPVICRHYDEAKKARLLKLIRQKEVRGVSVQNYEWLYLLQQAGYQGDIVADYYLYTMNGRAEEQLRAFGCQHFTAPVELNEKELWHMDRHNSEMLIYGYLPMMVTAQCIKKTLTGCSHQAGTELSLRDRYQKSLHVKNCCSECYNVIYNSVPLSLHKELSKLKSMQFAGLRLSFTKETAEEAAQIAKWYASAINDGTPREALTLAEYTKGHFARGVE